LIWRLFGKDRIKISNFPISYAYKIVIFSEKIKRGVKKSDFFLVFIEILPTFPS
jgi:hypothetical protein